MGMLATLPAELAPFGATLILAILIGLELHAYRRTTGGGVGFGTTRTLAMFAVLGFTLWIISPGQPWPFLTGFAGLALFLALDYRTRLALGDAALLPSVIGLFVYALGPLVLAAPVAVVAAMTVATLFALGDMAGIRKFSDAFPAAEGVTLAKFIILAGLVLPLLPDSTILGLAGITYVKVWTAVLLISGISYVSYLVHRYVFPQAGALLTGVLGGLYSSTAATVVLARSARAEPDSARLVPAAVVIATMMMYLRLFVVIIALGFFTAARDLALPFGLFVVSSAIVAFALSRGGALAPAGKGHEAPRNPLDLPIAFLFAGLFVAFAAITNFITTHYGANGLRILSFAVGFTDIDPFILSILSGKFPINEGAIVTAILTASGSNNMLKAIYAMMLSRQPRMAWAAGWLVALLFGSLIYSSLVF